MLSPVILYHSVYLRCSNGSLLFLRAEVMLKGAVFHIVFTDADQLPPPYRIDNMSEVLFCFTFFTVSCN